MVAPKTLPADGGSYGAVFATLADQNGLPTLATNATTVFLTSSLTSVGLTMNSSVVIGPGRSYAVAYIRTTETPGRTTITASSPGLKSSDVVVNTAAPTGYPSVIALSAVPAQVVPQSKYPGILIVQLQDSTGLPARAFADTQVRLLSSNANVLNVSDSITIGSGNFSSTTSFSTGYVPGQAIVTGTSPGLGTGSTSVSVAGPAALGLKLYAQPDKMVVCSPQVTSCTGRLVVGLVDQGGNPARAVRPLTVQVRSSNLGVLQAPLSAVISPGNISAIVPYTTSQSAGSALVTVSAPGLRSDTANVTTVRPVPPTALKLFVGPSPVLADHRSYSSVVVSLVGVTKNGTFPAINSSGPTLVTITSSLAATGNFSTLFLTIPAGQNFVSTAFTSTFLVGNTSLTASSQNLNPAFAGLGTAGAVPSSLIITALSQSIPADGGIHPAIEVNLQDSLGQPALAPSDLPVYISSGVSQVVQFNSPVIVPAGRSSLLVNATTTTVTGVANITAYASLQSSSPTLAKSVLLTTVTPAPSSVTAFTVPGKFVLSKVQPDAKLVVQLQDSKGNPARARHDTLFTVTSSSNSVFNRTLTAKIAQGDDLAYLPLTPGDTGSTQFTVSSSGLGSSSVELTVLAAPIQASLSPSTSAILQNQTDLIQLSVTFEGTGLARANVTWQAAGGSLTPPSSRTDSNGRTSAVFAPSASGFAKINALISHPVLAGENLTASVLVTPVPQRQQATIMDEVLAQAPLVHVPYVALAAAAIVVAVLLVLVIRRSRRVEEVVGEGYEEATAS